MQADCALIIYGILTKLLLAVELSPSVARP